MATVQSNNLALPLDIQQKLQELELELAEGRTSSVPFLSTHPSLGDITQKGFEKKRVKLLTSYQQKTSKSRDEFEKESHLVVTLEDETQANKNINNNNNNNSHHEKPTGRPSKLHCRRQKRDGYNRYHSGTQRLSGFALSSHHPHVIVVDHSDVRQEAVKQALEQFGARPIPSSKRATQSQPKSNLTARVSPSHHLCPSKISLQTKKTMTTMTRVPPRT